MKIFSLAFILLTFSSLNYSQNKIGTLLENKIITIKPSEFKPSANCPKMPLHIVEFLEKSDCLIPQSDYIKNTHNAFQIQFAKTGQNDWAVLCSKNGFSSIWMFWNSSIRNVSQFASYSDKDFINANGYFRVIGKDTSKPSNEENLKLYRNIIPQIDTWGIDEQTADGAGVIYYLYQNQLIELKSNFNFADTRH